MTPARLAVSTRLLCTADGVFLIAPAEGKRSSAFGGITFTISLLSCGHLLALCDPGKEFLFLRISIWFSWFLSPFSLTPTLFVTLKLEQAARVSATDIRSWI